MPWEMMLWSGLGAIMVAFLWIVPIILIPVAVGIYVVSRLRERGGPPDPHIGIKTAHHLFYTFGILMLLAGITLISVELMLVDDFDRRGGMGNRGFGGPIQRTFFEQPSVRIGLALMLVGGVFALMHRVLLLATNNSKQSNVGRAFLGVRFALAGLLVMFILAAMLSALFQVNAQFREIKPFLGMLIVWTPAWILFMTFLLIGTPRPFVEPDYDRPSPDRPPYDDEGSEPYGR